MSGSGNARPAIKLFMLLICAYVDRLTLIHPGLSGIGTELPKLWMKSISIKMEEL